MIGKREPQQQHQQININNKQWVMKDGRRTPGEEKPNAIDVDQLDSTGPESGI
jgi:hypothetical protein